MDSSMLFILIFFSYNYCFWADPIGKIWQLKPTSNHNTITHLIFRIHNKKNIINNHSNKLTIDENKNLTNKTFLKDILNDDLTVNINKSEQLANEFQLEKAKNYPINTCQVQSKIININIGKECGRISLNTTSCLGLCKSSEKLMANIKITQCSACKAVRYVFIKRQIKCTDSTIKHILVKQVTECSCFKISDTIATLNSAVV